MTQGFDQKQMTIGPSRQNYREKYGIEALNRSRYAIMEITLSHIRRIIT